MNDVNNSDVKMLEFLKFVLTEFTQKITTVTSTMNDVTSQIRTLSTISTQSPTRSELLAKISTVITEIKEQLDTYVVENIQDHHKDITAFHQIHYEKIINKMDNREKDHMLLDVEIKEVKKQIKETNQSIDELTANIKSLSEKIDKMVISISTLYKILVSIVGLTPILWGLFHFINSITVHK